MNREQFEKRYVGRPYELIEGEIIKTPIRSALHGLTVSYLNYHLVDFVRKAAGLGDVVTGTGFWLSDKTLLGVDGAFIRAEKASGLNPHKFVPFPPDLAVEVIDFDESPASISTRARCYREAQTPLVWFIHPHLATVEIYENGERTHVSPQGTLSGGDVLPGLHIKVAELFADAD